MLAYPFISKSKIMNYEIQITYWKDLPTICENLWDFECL
jgi:hypothetical protein